MQGKFTPDYEHFLRNARLRHNVYEPEADTFLFLDGIDVEVDAIMARLIGRLRERAWSALEVEGRGAENASATTHRGQKGEESAANCTFSNRVTLSNSPTRQQEQQQQTEEEDRKELDHAHPQPFSAVEIGCGSGLVITHLGMNLQRALVAWCLGALEAAKKVESAACPVGSSPVHSPSPADVLIAESVMGALRRAAQFPCQSTRGEEEEQNPKQRHSLLLAPPFADFYFVDINPLALESARQTWGINMAAQLSTIRKEVLLQSDAAVPPHAASSSSDDHNTKDNGADEKKPMSESLLLAPVTLLITPDNMNASTNGEKAFCLVKTHLRAKNKKERAQGRRDTTNGSNNDEGVESKRKSGNKESEATVPSLFSCTGILGSLFAPFVASFYKDKDNSEGDKKETTCPQNGEAETKVSTPLVNFDVALFNPPYVPTDDEELKKATIENDIITAAWCGGPRGRVVVDEFMRQVFFVLRSLQTVVVERRIEVRHATGLPDTETDQRREGEDENASHSEREGFALTAFPPLHTLAPASGLLYIVAIRENDVADLCEFTNDCFCDADEIRVCRLTRAMLLSKAGPTLRTVSSADREDTERSEEEGLSNEEEPSPSAATILGALLTMSTVTERWTGEHLSILKFEMVPESLEDVQFT